MILIKSNGWDESESQKIQIIIRVIHCRFLAPSPVIISRELWLDLFYIGFK